MRHHNKNKKFGREKDVRNALMRSLAVCLVREEKIKTTETKAKALRPYIEKLVTKARKNSIASRRLVISRLGSSDEGKKLVDDIAPRYTEREGGYTRITKLTPREGDASSMAIIEFV